MFSKNTYAPELLTAPYGEAKNYVLGKNGRPKKGEERNLAIGRVKYGTNSAAYLTARLARDRPDLLEEITM
jgi:hypothetical protein